MAIKDDLQRMNLWKGACGEADVFVSVNIPRWIRLQAVAEVNMLRLGFGLEESCTPQEIYSDPFVTAAWSEASAAAVESGPWEGGEEAAEAQAKEEKPTPTTPRDYAAADIANVDLETRLLCEKLLCDGESSLTDAEVIFKKLCVLLSTLGRYNVSMAAARRAKTPAQQGYQTATTRPVAYKQVSLSLDRIGRSLFHLRLYERDPAVRPFLAIYYSTTAAAAFLQPGQNRFAGWAGYWTRCFGTDDFGAVQSSFIRLAKDFTTVSGLALKAINTCDLTLLCDYRDQLCKALTSAYGAWREIICHFERLQASPMYQAGMFDRALYLLNRTGLYAAAALRAFHEIALRDEDCYERLVQGWTQLQQTMPKIRTGVRKYAESKLCPDRPLCDSALAELDSIIQNGKIGAECLRRNPNDTGHLRKQTEYADRFETILEKTFSGRGISWRYMTGFWWPLAQIRLVLADCCCEDEECVLTTDQLCKVVDWIKARVPKKRAICCGSIAHPPAGPWVPPATTTQTPTLLFPYVPGVADPTQQVARLNEFEQQLEITRQSAAENVQVYLAGVRKDVQQLRRLVELRPEYAGAEALERANRIKQQVMALPKTTFGGEARASWEALASKLTALDIQVVATGA